MKILVPIDAEALVVEYLTAKMPTYDVSTRLRDRSGAITVENTSGTRRSPIHDHPIVTIQCWHDDEITAGDMCRTAVGWLWSMHDDPDFGTRVREVAQVGGPQTFPDPTAKTPRWQAAVELNLRPASLSA